MSAYSKTAFGEISGSVFAYVYFVLFMSFFAWLMDRPDFAIDWLVLGFGIPAAILSMVMIPVAALGVIWAVLVIHHRIRYGEWKT